MYMHIIQGYTRIRTHTHTQAAISRRQDDEAITRYREATGPKYFALWQEHMHTLRLQLTCLYHYNIRCRQKPHFEAWVFEVGVLLSVCMGSRLCVCVSVYVCLCPCMHACMHVGMQS